MKRKFILLSVFICFILCGCTPIEDMTLDEIVDNGVNRKVEVYNTYRKGYKYNVPKGLKVIDSSEYNEVLRSTDYTYYLYVDAVSYYNKVIEPYEENELAFISKQISHEDKYGYLEINEISDEKYFIEIMYNYAKIEVIVKEKDINIAVSYALSVLSSINFDTNILKTLLDEEVSQFKDYEFNIFETNSNNENSEYMDAVDSDVYEEEEIHDTDLID